MPVARHKLEQAYSENSAAIPQHAYWTSDFVGTGPFVVREFVLGSHLTLTANERYVLGRPKVDEIEIRFITVSEDTKSSFWPSGRRGTNDTCVPGRGKPTEARRCCGSAWAASVETRGPASERP